MNSLLWCMSALGTCTATCTSRGTTSGMQCKHAIEHNVHYAPCIQAQQLDLGLQKFTCQPAQHCTAAAQYRVSAYMRNFMQIPFPQMQQQQHPCKQPCLHRFTW